MAEEEKTVDIDTSGPGAEVELPVEESKNEQQTEKTNEDQRLWPLGALLGGLLGSLLGHFGGLLGRLGRIWGVLGPPLGAPGPSGDGLGASRGRLGRTESVLEAPWRID